MAIDFTARHYRLIYCPALYVSFFRSAPQLIFSRSAPQVRPGKNGMNPLPYSVSDKMGCSDFFPVGTAGQTGKKLNKSLFKGCQLSKGWQP